MVQTVYISANNTATIQCPECGKVKTTDVSAYAGSEQRVIINCSCTCGNKFRCRLEKRKQYRKEIDLPGKFYLLDDRGAEDTGLLKVVDISKTGLKLKLNTPRDFPIGTSLLIEFSLDDRNRTLMKKRVTVRNVSGPHVGTSFLPSELDDPALGFYLMP
jgi:hypothetical protein